MAEQTVTLEDISREKDNDLKETNVHFSTADIRNKFSEIKLYAQVNGPVIITDHGKPTAAVVPIKTVRLMEILGKVVDVNKLSSIPYKTMTEDEIRSFLLAEINGEADVHRDTGGDVDNENSRKR